MENNMFISIVKKHFNYLVLDYGFNYLIIYGEESIGDALIEYRTLKTIVTIVLDRLDIIVRIGPFGEDNLLRLTPEVLSDYFTSGKDTLPVPKLHSLDDQNVLDSILQQYAEYLKKHCDMILKGDFSVWGDALIYFLDKSRKQYRDLTGVEMSPKTYRDIEEYIYRKQRK